MSGDPPLASRMARLTDLTVAGFVDAIGQDRPTPGCGAAGAVGLALAAACARKALTISARRADGDLGLEAAAERCRLLAEAALDGAERDTLHFGALLKANSEDGAPAAALEDDARVLLALATELRELIGRCAAEVSEALAGDTAAALDLIAAFEQIEARNRAEVSSP